MKHGHGGPDAQGPARWDFSTNVNAAGPCPPVLAALQQVDATRYPDAGYHALRERLAAWHGVAASRIVLAASGSEFIQRFTAVSGRLAPGPVALPAQAYGDYARAAQACARAIASQGDGDGDGDPQATLRWCCEPSSPLGQDAPPPADLSAPRTPPCGVRPPRGSSKVAKPHLLESAVPTLLDAVYAPLRLHGASRWGVAACQAVFVLHSSNKALGLAGVRAAYAVAPAGAGWQRWIDALDAASPSWPLGAHGVALLEGWASAAAQHWLATARDTLRLWKAQQTALLAARGFELLPSVASFFCARAPVAMAVPATQLRRHGVLLRDAASFGLPGWVRLSVQPPVAQAALMNALDSVPEVAE